MKRKSGFFLCAALILSVLSTSGAASGDVLVPLKHVVDVRAAETAGNVVGTAGSKEEFNALLQKALKNLDTDFIIQYTGSDIKELFRELDADETGKYFYGTKAYQWNMKNASFSTKGKPGNMPIRLKIDYHHTAAEEEKLNVKVETVLRRLISPKMTEVQKIDAIHDYLVLRSSYGKTTKKSAHSAYTLMTEGCGVCQAYSALASRMLERLGFEVCFVNGMTDEAHSWLKVKVGGEWYNLDITYDDPVPNQKNKVFYRHALVSDAKISATHKQSGKLAFPSATSTKFDARNDGRAKTFSEEEVLRMIGENAKKGGATAKKK